jgi:hypothetical protein
MHLTDTKNEDRESADEEKKGTNAGWTEWKP